MLGAEATGCAVRGRFQGGAGKVPTTGRDLLGLEELYCKASGAPWGSLVRGAQSPSGPTWVGISLVSNPVKSTWTGPYGLALGGSLWLLRVYELGGKQAA
jgi:hypothetical protein